MAAEEERALLGPAGGGGDDDGGGGGSPGSPRALPAVCDPRRLPHRLLVLALMCFLGFGGWWWWWWRRGGLGWWGRALRPPLLLAGSYFCYDNPAALQTQVQRVSSCLGRERGSWRPGRYGPGQKVYLFLFGYLFWVSVITFFNPPLFFM